MTLLTQLRVRPRLLTALALGVLAAVLWPWGTPTPLQRLLLGWNVSVWGYLVSMAWVMRRADSAHVRVMSRQQAEGMGVVLVLAVLGAAASFAAVTAELAHLGRGAGGSTHALLALVTVLGAWLLLPVEFALAYASLYHRGAGAPHGLEFPGDEGQPLDYLDFLYFSITIAATSQTSDVGISTQAIRRLVLVQAVLAFIFNAGVLAMAINVAAGLLS